MKNWFLLTLGLLFIASAAMADDVPALSIPSYFSVKQGMLIKWHDPEAGIKNLSTVTIAETHADSSFGGWNALWDGWMLDTGFAYDAAGINSAALLVGRDFGTLGKYLPIDFPLKDKIQLTIYPVGIYAEDLFDHPSIQGASGIGLVKFNVSW